MGSQWLSLAGGFGSGLCGGFLSGMFGIGGGIILIPMLALLLGLDQHKAQGVTLAALILPNGLPAVLHFRSRGIPIHWPVVGLLTLGFLPAVWGGARLAARIPDGPLRTVFGVVLILMALRTWFQAPAADRPSGPPPTFRSALVPALAIGAIGGLASGLLGIGGGIIIIPLLGWTLHLNQHEAQAACLAFMLAPIGLPGVIVYASHQGGLPWAILGGVAVGFMAGAYLGARASTRIRGRHLRKAFAVLLGCVALMMLI